MIKDSARATENEKLQIQESRRSEEGKKEMMDEEVFRLVHTFTSSSRAIDAHSSMAKHATELLQDKSIYLGAIKHMRVLPAHYISSQKTVKLRSRLKRTQRDCIPTRHGNMTPTILDNRRLSSEHIKRNEVNIRAKGRIYHRMRREPPDRKPPTLQAC